MFRLGIKTKKRNKTNKRNKRNNNEGLKKLEIVRTNKIKELEEIEIELKSLGVKIIIKKIKDNLEEFEIKMLKIETENKMEALKQAKKEYVNK